MAPVSITIPAKKIAIVLAIIAVYLTLQSLIIAAIDREFNPDLTDFYRAVRRLSNVNAENNIPTWYSSALLFLSGLTATIIALVQRAKRDPFRWHWTGLAIIFTLMSLDETASIHESLTDPLQVGLDTSGYLRAAWIIVGIPAVIVFLVVYARFIARLPLLIRNLFILSITLYVGSIIGIEAISAQRRSADKGFPSFVYTVTATTEELFEMLGAVLFLYTLLSFLDTIVQTIHLTITGTPEPEANAEANPVTEA